MKFVSDGSPWILFVFLLFWLLFTIIHICYRVLGNLSERAREQIPGKFLERWVISVDITNKHINISIIAALCHFNDSVKVFYACEQVRQTKKRSSTNHCSTNSREVVWVDNFYHRNTTSNTNKQLCSSLFSIFILFEASLLCIIPDLIYALIS